MSDMKESLELEKKKKEEEKTKQNPEEVRKSNSSPSRSQPVALPSKTTSASVTVKDSSKLLSTAAPTGAYEMWVDKYKPKAPKDLIGNGSAVKSITEWLQKWYPKHVDKSEPLPKNDKANTQVTTLVVLFISYYS